MIQLLLGQAGLVTSKAMLSQWRWVVVGATVAAAVLTPSTDPFTQTLLAVPLVGLYMGGALAVKAIETSREGGQKNDFLCVFILSLQNNNNNNNNNKKVEFSKHFFLFSPADPTAAASAGGRVDAPQRRHPADARAGAGASSISTAAATTEAAAAPEAEASSSAISASASLFLVVGRGVRVEDRAEEALDGADDGEEKGQDGGVPWPLLDDGACFFIIEQG